MPIAPDAAALIEMLDQVFPKVDEVDSAFAAREQMKALNLPSQEEVGSVQDRTIDGPNGPIPVRIYQPKLSSESISGRIGVVYLHGGGWVICDLDSHDGGCRRFANALNAIVISVDYRLAPENQFPAAVDDAWAATQWVGENADELGIDVTRVVVAGDSAGGNLAAVVAQKARDEGEIELAYQLLIYPVIDSSTTRNDYPSKTENSTGYFLTKGQMEWYRNQYLPSEAEGENPHVSPHLASSLSGLAPAGIVTAEMDPLRDEGEHYGKLLIEAGVETTIYRAPGMFHGFFNMESVLPGARDAQEVVFNLIKDALTTEET